MLPKTHFWITLIPTIIITMWGVTTPLQAMFVFVGGFLIDVDKWLVYLFRNKDWSIKRAYNWFKPMYEKNEKRKFLCIFHTIESFVLVFALGFIHPLFFYLLAGMVLHIILDIIQAVHRKHYAKYFSVIEYFIKNSLHKA